MLFHNKSTETPAPSQQPQPTVSLGGMEFYGDPILPSGEQSMATVPESLRDVLDRIDINSLPIDVNAKTFLEKIQRQALIATTASAADLGKVPVQKITSLSQLTAEQRAALSSMLGQRSKEEQTSAAAPDGVSTFGSAEELFAHVGKRMATMNAAAIHQEAVNLANEPLETKPTPAPRPAAEALPRPVTEPASQPVSQSPSGITNCPHCGLSLFVKAEDTTDEQRRNFMVSVLHGQPYTEQLELFGGALAVTFASLTNAQADYLEVLTMNVIARTDVSDLEKSVFFVRAALAMGVIEVRIGDEHYRYHTQVIEENIDNGVDGILGRYAELSARVPVSAVMETLCREVLKFNVRCRTLTAAGMNPDFWKPTR